METQVNYKLEEAYEKLNVAVEQNDWKITGTLPLESDIIAKSQSQSKKMQRAINRVVKKCTRFSLNSLLHKISKNTELAKAQVEIGDKERAIQTKRKAWKLLQAQSEAALQSYNEEKGDFYKTK